MTAKLYSLFFGLLFLCGCKEKVYKANPLQLTVDRYSYQFEADKLVSETETISYYSNGVILDRIKMVKRYSYDDKGRLLKTISKMSMDSLSTVKEGVTSVDTFSPTSTLYRYNSADSIIETLDLKANGDTSYWFLYDFFPDGKQIVKGVKFKANDKAKRPEEFAKSVNENYSYKREYIYSNKLCRQISEYDASNKLQETTVKDYTKTPPYNLFKITHCTYDNSPLFDTPVLARKEIRYENYEKAIPNKSKTDFCLLNFKGDTLKIQTSDFDEKGKVSEQVLIDFERNGEWFRYFDNGTLKKEIFISYYDKEKWTTYFYYYPNGKLKETRKQREYI